MLQSEMNLITLGWIHTHPTQDAFLSSVDMHTHFGYQAMLDEAVAVVMAPRKQPSCGLFRLTAKGLNEMQTCSKRGFHEHRSAEPLFEPCDASRAVVLRGIPHFQVIDTRRAPPPATASS